MTRHARSLATLGVAALLAGGLVRAAAAGPTTLVSLNRMPHPRWQYGRILLRISRQEAVLRVPAPVAVLVFDEGCIRGYDRGGWMRVQQPRSGYRAHTTTFHDRVNFHRHCLLTEGPSDQVYLSLPPGTAFVRVQQAQEMFDGQIQALDAHYQVLASERNTDFQLVPVHTDPVALTIEGRMLYRGGHGRVCIRVPGGTHLLQLSGARIHDDGSILALDAHHRVLASQSAWNGCPEVIRFRAHAGPTLFQGSFPDAAAIRVMPGTREVDFDPRCVILRDAHGRVLRREAGVEVVIHDL